MILPDHKNVSEVHGIDPAFDVLPPVSSIPTSVLEGYLAVKQETATTWHLGNITSGTCMNPDGCDRELSVVFSA